MKKGRTNSFRFRKTDEWKNLERGVVRDKGLLHKGPKYKGFLCVGHPSKVSSGGHF